MPKDPTIKKVLVIGSGPIVIGQAAEFDYAGTQACRQLAAQGVDTVLVNSNPATIMTDADTAGTVYIEPLNAATVRRIIEKERPDSLLAGLGGQTGLNIALELYNSGALDELGVRLIGTNIDAIMKSEDRQLFKDAMERIGQPTIPSRTVTDVESALRAAEEVGYPVIVRPAFTLGGSGGGVANDELVLRSVAASGIEASPIDQILVEKYVYGWKEIEFEVMRDGAGSAVTVCGMENMDPVGVHTGDSIVVAPTLTLADREYQLLRSAALAIITEMGIEGGCNCQFALDPESFDYAVIEVNPRVSRSSALASKATGYPIAKVSVMIALGYRLDEIRNEITGGTFACFEPALDYVVVKLPRWPFDKFHGASRALGTQMKATGEVMAIAPTFEQALMKAVRGAGTGLDTLDRPYSGRRPIDQRLRDTDDRRLFTVFEALKQGVEIGEICAATRIDKWFIEKLRNLADFELAIENSELDGETYGRGKALGYTDAALARLSGHAVGFSCRRSYRMVDTCAAEFEALTPYYYSVPYGHCDARERLGGENKPSVIVLGSGPIRIGQGIEFDYSCVHCARTLRELGYDVVMINNNPETVSTDYDTATRLYFEPLCPEDVLAVVEAEKPIGVVVAFGGQTAISLAACLVEHGVRILGTSAEGIDTAEDREKFDALLGTLGIDRPRGAAVRTLREALDAASMLGYPVLLRPSYVIGGQNMVIAHDEGDVGRYMGVILAGGIDNPVLIDKYMPGTELECDVISDGKRVLIPGIMEHIERAGIHSGDSIAVCPPMSLTGAMLRRVAECSEKLAIALGTRGLVNIQYLVYQKELYVIEVNPRASRTIPFMSKVTGVQMVDAATRVMMGASLDSLGLGEGLLTPPALWGVKAPVFSFAKLPDADSLLGPEMKSTGEVMGFGYELHEALYKALTASGCDFLSGNNPERSAVLLSVENRQFGEIAPLTAKLAELGIRIYATPDTAAEVRRLGLSVFDVGPIRAGSAIGELLDNAGIGLVIYTGSLHDDTMVDYLELHRVATARCISCFTSLDTALAAVDIMSAGLTEKNTKIISMRRQQIVV